MQVFIKTLNDGLHIDSLSLSDSFGDLKKRLLDQNVIDVEDYLTYNGQRLEDLDNVLGFNIPEKATLFVTSSLYGGAKKRKKKVYSTPKRIKHKAKKVKLRILNYYSVDQQGNVTRQLSHCQKCGPSVFLANHHDRLYCGKCCQSTRKAIST